MSERLLTPAEVASILRLHVETVRGFIRAGDLGHVRDGRRIYVPASALTAFIDAHAVDRTDPYTQGP